MGKLLDKFNKIKEEEISKKDEQRLEAILKGITTIEGPAGPKGDSPTKEELVSIIKPLIPKPIKGDKGDKPIAGVDFPIPKNGKDGENGKTPIPGLDYPTEETVKKMLAEIVPKDEQFKPLIERLVREFSSKMELEAEKIARALETLKGKAKLDYFALKNTPTIPGEEQIGNQVRTIMRGGGDTVKTYDLDSLLDGATKTFTLPKHRKIILVVGTSAPFRFLATTDYTRTTTSITFTSAVDAPTSLASGQGVSVLYV